jgi:hypothetical protein
MGQVMIPHQVAGRIDMIDNPIEQGDGVESSPRTRITAGHDITNGSVA